MKLRALEKYDLRDVHLLKNHTSTMALWFNEPYASFDELSRLYDKHVLDEKERRFVIDVDGNFSGIVELIDITSIHRTCEIQIIVNPDLRGRGYGKQAFRKGLEYAFKILNLRKVILYVDCENEAGLSIYTRMGFVSEGKLRGHFFADGEYRDSYIMGLFKDEFQKKLKEAEEEKSA